MPVQYTLCGAYPRVLRSTHEFVHCSLLIVQYPFHSCTDLFFLCLLSPTKNSFNALYQVTSCQIRRVLYCIFCVLPRILYCTVQVSPLQCDTVTKQKAKLQKFKRFTFPTKKTTLLVVGGNNYFPHECQDWNAQDAYLPTVQSHRSVVPVRTWCVHKLENLFAFCSKISPFYAAVNARDKPNFFTWLSWNGTGPNREGDVHTAKSPHMSVPIYRLDLRNWTPFMVVKKVGKNKCW